MESIYPELALCCSQNECIRTDNDFFPIYEVSRGMVSLVTKLKNSNCDKTKKLKL